MANRQSKIIRNSGTIKCLAFGFLLFLFLPSIVTAIAYQIPPANMPSGLPAEIKGKYRIIEHDRSQKMWYAYDVQKWKKNANKEFSEDGIRMYPPIHMYTLCSDGWFHEIVNKPMDNEYMMELVTIIEKDKPLKQLTLEGKQLSLTQAQNAVAKAFYPVNKHLWSFKSVQYNNGVLICAYSQNLPDAIGIWWAKGNKVYNVNGIARSKTKKFQLTFDPSISVPDSLAHCKSYR